MSHSSAAALGGGRARRRDRLGTVAGVVEHGQGPPGAEGTTRTFTTPYDELPYGMLVHANTHPVRLATAAALRGVHAAAMDGCRVADLGCAEATQLLYWAEAHPDSEFVGIEVAAQQVTFARERIRSLGLTNVVVHHGDVAELGPELGAFDYIVCHGVYSWVPEAVRDRILSWCRAQLSDTGLAYVSYNANPGWAHNRPLRDLLLLAADGASDLREAVVRCRTVLQHVRGQLDTTTPYGALLHDRIDELLEKPDTAIAHEYLAPHNDAVYVDEFTAHAGAHDLRYLEDLAVRSGPPFNGAGGGVPRTLADVTAQRELDFLRGTTFRAALLCRGDVEVLDERELETVLHLHAAAAITPSGDVDAQGGTEAVFTGRLGGRLHTRSPRMKAALGVLADRWPDSVPVAELVATSGGSEDRAEVDDLLRQLVSLHAQGACELTTERFRLTTEVSGLPVVAGTARLALELGEPVANRRYERVGLDPLLAFVAVRLDGTRDAPAVEAVVLEAADRGELSIADEHGDPIEDPVVLRAEVARLVPHVLGVLAREGMLAG